MVCWNSLWTKSLGKLNKIWKEENELITHVKKIKVILVNGSPKEKGCTYTALKEVETALNKNGIETEVFWLGNKPVAGCIGCGSCLKTG